MPPPLKVCIVGLKCYDHIAGNPTPRYLGGIETQLAALARGLAGEHCEVSLITFDHGQPDGEVFSGVKVLKSHRPEGGIPLLRSFHPRSTLLWRAMRRANADVYLQMGAGIETGQAALGCRLIGGKRSGFVYCLASDMDYGQQLKAGLEGRAYLFGLRHATRIVAQTQRQQEGLRQAVGLETVIIPMAASAPAGELTGIPPQGPPHVLWVGRITPDKRLEWLLEAAGRCPDLVFDIVGAPNRDSEYASGVLLKAGRLANVNVHGRASRDKLAVLYGHAAVLCCTSAMEGFPTTFLEAWSCGIPVVTTFDPDGVVRRHRLGFVADDPESLVSHLQSITSNPGIRAEKSAAARQYHAENHALETVSRRFHAMLAEAVGRN